MNTLQLYNPATGQAIEAVTTNKPADITSYIAPARAAQKAWAKVPFNERLQIIQAFGEAIIEQVDELALTLCKETGKPLQQAKNEIKGAQNRIQFFGEEMASYLAPTHAKNDPGTQEYLWMEPIGLIGNISAWNYPYNVGFNIFIPALLAGNAVFYKPSELVALTGLAFKQAFDKVGLPKHLFNLIQGKGEIGAALIDVGLDAYFFTGSYKTGVKIAQQLAPQLKPLQLELGGKDPLYIMEDVADVKKAAVNAAEGAFYNNGQSCCAVERIYVHAPIYEEFVAHFVEEVKSYNVGDPLHPDTFIGPLARKEQIPFLANQVADAVQKGATILLGGKAIAGKGYYFEPTVLVDVTHHMEVMKEESFGPIIGIQKVSNDAEALQLMNDTNYGLTAAIFSSDEARAEAILSQVDAGTVYWNCCDRVSPWLPWSGRNSSGLGSSLASFGIQSFLKPKAYHKRPA